MNLTRAECDRLVGEAFEGRRQLDDLCLKALAVVGLSVKDFKHFQEEARKCERGNNRFLVLIPAGGKVR